MSGPAWADRRWQFLAISGSLRAVSSNTTLLRAAALLAPEGVTISLYPSIADLPHFNPDLDGEGDAPPDSVADFRARLRGSDGVLISSPEYAHGVPGSLKNALDWVVGTGEFMDKPVALLNASATATLAHASLTETLTVMMARVFATRVPLSSNKTDLEAILADPGRAQALQRAVESLAEAALARP